MGICSVWFVSCQFVLNSASLVSQISAECPVAAGVSVKCVCVCVCVWGRELCVICSSVVDRNPRKSGYRCSSQKRNPKWVLEREKERHEREIAVIWPLVNIWWLFLLVCRSMSVCNRAAKQNWKPLQILQQTDLKTLDKENHTHTHTHKSSISICMYVEQLQESVLKLVFWGVHTVTIVTVELMYVGSLEEERSRGQSWEMCPYTGIQRIQQRRKKLPHYECVRWIYTRLSVCTASWKFVLSF